MSDFSARSRLALFALPLIGGPAAAAVDPADQARISEEAVKTYLAKKAADDAAASDKRVAANSASLFNDPGSAVMGNPNGDVTIVEFFDYNCPFSQRVEPRVEALLKSDAKVRLVLKEFPIIAAASSPPAGRAALAALRQGKYSAYHMQMLSVPGRKMEMTQIFDEAQKVGLDIGQLKKDMEAPAYYDQLIANMNLARAVRIFQTPTFIIGGHIVTQASAEIDFPKLVAAARAA